MKRTLFVIGGVVVLILLIVRMIFVQIGRQDDARRDFVSKLNYSFGARVDSVGLFHEKSPVGFIYIKTEGDTIDRKERKIVRSLKKKHNFRFLVTSKKGRLEIFHKDANKFKEGDSIYIDSSKDNMRLYRGDSVVMDFSISKIIRG